MATYFRRIASEPLELPGESREYPGCDGYLEELDVKVTYLLRTVPRHRDIAPEHGELGHALVGAAGLST